MSKYKDIHVASRFYLARWAGSDGRLQVVTLPDLASESCRPESVGHRPRLWGSSPALRRDVEEALGPHESKAAVVMRSLKTRWPLQADGDERLAIAMFVALHFWRAPDSFAGLRLTQPPLIDKQLRTGSREMSSDQVDQFLKLVSSDEWRSSTFKRFLPKTAGAFASMHWTLVEFDEPVLATSDQPVTMVPIMKPGDSSPVRAVPDVGILNCQEIRVAIDPRHALLLTWRDGLDTAMPVVGSDWISAQLNRAVIGQADTQWFHHPDRRPVTVTPPLLDYLGCEPVAPKLLHGYGVPEVIGSERRRQVDDIVTRQIDDDDDSTAVILKPGLSVEPLAA